MKKSFLTVERGSALIFTVLLIFILSVIAPVLISLAMTNFTLMRNGSDYDTTYYLADGAAEEVIAEIANLTENAEFEALSQMDEYADKCKDSFVVEIGTDTNTGDIIYNIDEDGFKAEMKAHYSFLYLKYLIDKLETSVESVEFAPDFNNSFQASNPVDSKMKSPASLNAENLKDGTEIVIVNTGKYSIMERKITLTFVINVPNYSFNASSHRDYISYDGYDDKTNLAFELKYWNESNINE